MVEWHCWDKHSNNEVRYAAGNGKMNSYRKKGKMEIRYRRPI